MQTNVSVDINSASKVINSASHVLQPTNRYIVDIPVEIWVIIFQEIKFLELVRFGRVSKKAKVLVWENFSDKFRNAAQILGILTAFPVEEQTKRREKGLHNKEKTPSYTFKVCPKSEYPDWYQELNTMLKPYMCYAKTPSAQGILACLRLNRVGGCPIDIPSFKELVNVHLASIQTGKEFYRSIFEEMMDQGFIEEAGKVLDSPTSVKDNRECLGKVVECYAKLGRYDEACKALRAKIHYDAADDKIAINFELLYTLGSYAYQNKKYEFLDKIIQMNVGISSVFFSAIRISLYLDERNDIMAQELFNQHAFFLLAFVNVHLTYERKIEESKRDFIEVHILKAMSHCWRRSENFDFTLNSIRNDKQALQTWISWLSDCKDQNLVCLR